MSPLPGLLLLHGVGDSGECWGPFVARLRAHGDGSLAALRVSTPDAPAHAGHPSAPGRTIAAPDQIAVAVGHAEDLVSSTGGPIVVGGHSMGSGVALAVAAERPDLIRGLWLEDPPLLTPMAVNDAADPDTPVDGTQFGAWFDDLQALGLDEVIALARVEHPGWDEGEYEPWARAKCSVDTTAFLNPVPWVAARWAARARSITVPTVLVVGDPEAGSVTHPTAAQELGALPGWSVHHVMTGHDVRRDAPDEVVPLLAELIRSVSP